MTDPIQSIDSSRMSHPVAAFPGGDYQKSKIQPELALALELTNKLQSTLELESLIELFVNTISKTIPHDAASYQTSIGEFLLSFGQQARHQVSYNLKVLEQDLGRVGFSRKTRFTQTETEQLENLLAILLYPLRNALLYREAIQSSFVDALTGVKNRAAYESNLSREIEISRRRSSELSLIVFDIDHFKRVNDRFGHTVGDLVLKNVAQAVEASIRCSDALYRIGGEEFVVVLNGTDRSGAQLLAERIRKNIESLVFTSPRALNVTLSLGVATLVKEDSARKLFERADAALYRAKGTGRNQVIVSE
ncbi:MAG: GGDEF domain-containing protein [Pseudomonadota bacterium]